MGLDIFFQKHKNSNLKIERAFANFYDEYNEDMLVSEARALADKFGVTDRLDIEEHQYGDLRYVTAERNDTEDVGYMRKHNHLLPYFNYADDCSDKFVSKTEVEAFIDDAKTVLSHRGEEDAQEVADDLIPTESGFFFGSTEYDDYYYACLEEDIRIFEEILEDFDFNNDILIMHCWW